MPRDEVSALIYVACKKFYRTAIICNIHQESIKPSYSARKHTRKPTVLMLLFYSHEMQKTSILVDFPFEFNNQSPVFVQNVYKVF